MPDGHRAYMGMGQPVDGGLEQPVLFDVLGVLVVGHLNGQREPVPASDLVSEPDLAPHGVEGFFLPAVAAQEIAVDGSLGSAREG